MHFQDWNRACTVDRDPRFSGVANKSFEKSPEHTGQFNYSRIEINVPLPVGKMRCNETAKSKKSSVSLRQLSQQTLIDFINRWDVGLAIFDEHLRYLAVNPWLAARNGLGVDRHIGKHLKEVIGEVASSFEPALKTALTTGQPIFNVEAECTLPIKREGKRWVANFLPTKGTDSGVKEIAAIFVETGVGKTEHAISACTSSNGDLLRSWKEIASYVGTCVKTAQRWEDLHDLPVRRVTSSKGAVVFALRSEIDHWMRSHPMRTNYRHEL
jgi:transcriptional regulator with PAS, ATPase and Fis domain